MTEAMRSAGAAAAAAALAWTPALAEKADRDKPTNIEANRMSSDDARRMSIFEGNVVLTKGTMQVRADRIVVRQDADGFQLRHRHRQAGALSPERRSEGRQGRRLDRRRGAAHRDRRAATSASSCSTSARVTRDQDEVNGDYIFVDQRTEFFSVSAAKDAAPASPAGRVKAVIQPKTKPEAK